MALSGAEFAMPIDIEQFRKIYYREAVAWIKVDRFGKEDSFNYRFYPSPTKAEELIGKYYPGGVDGFISDSDVAYRSRWKLICIIDDDEAVANFENDNPLMQLRLNAMESNIQFVKEEFIDALWHYERSPDSFDAVDLQRIKEGLDDPFMCDYMNDEYLEHSRESYLEFHHDSGIVASHEGIAINNYNAKVINTYTVPFIDVDTKDQQKVNRLLSELGNMGFGGRLYRTSKGHRIVLQQYVNAEELFTRFIPKPRQYGIDPSYVRVSKLMGTYRARLTAKPWRVGGADSRHASRYHDHYPVACFISNFGSYGALGLYLDHWQWIMNAHDATAIGNLHHTLSSDQLEDARHWLIDCFPDQEDEIRKSPDRVIESEIIRLYDGSLEAFVSDGNQSTEVSISNALISRDLVVALEQPAVSGNLMDAPKIRAIWEG